MNFLPQGLMANILTVLIFFPLAGALALVFLPRENERLLKIV